MSWKWSRPDVASERTWPTHRSSIPSHLHRRTQAQQHTPTSTHASGKYIPAIHSRTGAKATKHNPHSCASWGQFPNGRQIVLGTQLIYSNRTRKLRSLHVFEEKNVLTLHWRSVSLPQMRGNILPNCVAQSILWALNLSATSRLQKRIPPIFWFNGYLSSFARFLYLISSVSSIFFKLTEIKFCSWVIPFFKSHWNVSVIYVSRYSVNIGWCTFVTRSIYF